METNPVDHKKQQWAIRDTYFRDEMSSSKTFSFKSVIMSRYTVFMKWLSYAYKLRHLTRPKELVMCYRDEIHVTCIFFDKTHCSNQFTFRKLGPEHQKNGRSSMCLPNKLKFATLKGNGLIIHNSYIDMYFKGHNFKGT